MKLETLALPAELTNHDVVLRLSVHILLIQVGGKYLDVATTTVHLLLMLHCVLDYQGLPFVAERLEARRDGIEAAVLSCLQAFQQKASMIESATCRDHKFMSPVTPQLTEVLFAFPTVHKAAVVCFSTL